MLELKIPFKKQQFEAREEAILDAVNMLLSEKGFDLMTMDGRLVRSIPATVTGTYTQDLMLEGLSNGLYLLQVRNAEGTRLNTARFEVMR